MASHGGLTGDFVGILHPLHEGSHTVMFALTSVSEQVCLCTQWPNKMWKSSNHNNNANTCKCMYDRRRQAREAVSFFLLTEMSTTKHVSFK